MDAVDGFVAQWQRERPDLDHSPLLVVGRLSRVARRVEQALQANVKRHDLDRAGYDVLATLRRSGPSYALTPGQLLSTAMVTSSAITQRLDRLEQRALVTREAHPQDGRQVVVRLTELGRTLVDQVVPGHLALEQQLLSPLSPDQREQLASLLATLDTGLAAGSGEAARHAPVESRPDGHPDGDQQPEQQRT